jgi:hypothetical protein
MMGLNKSASLDFDARVGVAYIKSEFLEVVERRQLQHTICKGYGSHWIICLRPHDIHNQLHMFPTAL